MCSVPRPRPFCGKVGGEAPWAQRLQFRCKMQHSHYPQWAARARRDAPLRCTWAAALLCTGCRTALAGRCTFNPCSLSTHDEPCLRRSPRGHGLSLASRRESTLIMSMPCTAAHFQPMMNPAFGEAPVGTDCHRSLGGRASSSVSGCPSLRRERERQNLSRAGSATNGSRSNYGEGRSALRAGPESGPLPGPCSPLPLPIIRAEGTPGPSALGPGPFALGPRPWARGPRPWAQGASEIDSRRSPLPVERNTMAHHPIVFPKEHYEGHCVPFRAQTPPAAI